MLQAEKIQKYLIHVYDFKISENSLLKTKMLRPKKNPKLLDPSVGIPKK